MTSDPPRLSVVVPAFDEGPRIGATVGHIRDHLARREPSWEIVVVDDGSTDDTAAQAEAALGATGRVLRHPRNLGKGAAVRTGMLAARGARRLFTDADLSTPIEELDTLERAVDAGAAIAIGSRAVDRSLLEVRQPALRELAGRVFNLVVRLVAVPGIRDTQCGFKLFRADAAEALFRASRIQGFGFDVEVLALARRRGLPIAEIGVRWRNGPVTRVTLGGGASAFLDPLRVRLMLMAGRYDGPPPPA
jgi:glycosyltransferase involved in cell wall biosynthesis